MPPLAAVRANAANRIACRPKVVLAGATARWGGVQSSPCSFWAGHDGDAMGLPDRAIWFARRSMPAMPATTGAAASLRRDGRAARRRGSMAAVRALAVGLGAAAATAALGTAADAATATATMSVTLTIAATCTVVSASTLAFPTSGLLTANVDATSTITVLCTNTTPYTISLDKGVNGTSVTARQMKGAAASPDSVNYSLYRDASRTQNWGQTIGTDTVAGTGTGSNVGTTVYGRVPAQTSAKPDSYTDTITVTVTY